MIDREKVINSLKELSGFLFKEYGKAQAEEASLYYGRFLAVDNAIALLKEQVPLEPYACEGDMKCGNGCEIVGYIRESDGKIERLANYCPYCGRPVKWD